MLLSLHIFVHHCTLKQALLRINKIHVHYCSAVQHAARRLILFDPPVLAKFVRNNIMCKNQVEDKT